MVVNGTPPSEGKVANKNIIAAITENRYRAQRNDPHVAGTEQDLDQLTVIQRLHAFSGALQEGLRLALLLVQELDLDDGREMLLKKTVFLGGPFLDRIRGPAQGPFKLLSENKEQGH